MTSARELITRTVVVLTDVEWADHDIDGRETCPSCRGTRPVHDDDCCLASLFADCNRWLEENPE